MWLKLQPIIPGTAHTICVLGASVIALPCMRCAQYKQRRPHVLLSHLCLNETCHFDPHWKAREYICPGTMRTFEIIRGSSGFFRSALVGSAPSAHFVSVRRTCNMHKPSRCSPQYQLQSASHTQASSRAIRKCSAPIRHTPTWGRPKE